MGYSFSLWDFDGTLADTLSCLVETYNALAPGYGFKLVEDLEAVRGLAPMQLLRSLDIPVLKVPGLARKIRAAVRSRMPTLPFLPGLPEALRAVRQTGCRLAVLSSNARDNIEACLHANGLDGVFEAVVGYPRLFGKAVAIRRLLRSRAWDGRQTLYVGDEVRDVEAARKAGVAVAAVAWGFNTRALLAAAGPDHLIDRPEQLPELFQ